MTKEITAEIKKELPQQLLDKLTEVEEVLGESVKFIESDSLFGGSHGFINILTKQIWIASAARRNLGVAGEEIMHFHWRTKGLPRVNALEPSAKAGYDAALHQLGGHFEEYTFYPFLEELQLNPRAGIDTIMPATAADLQAGIERVKNERQNVGLRVLLAAKYVQAKLMSSGANGDQVLRIFEDDALKPFAKAFGVVCNEIVGGKDKAKDAVKEHLERILFTHLEVPKDAVEVKPAF